MKRSGLHINAVEQVNVNVLSSGYSVYCLLLHLFSVKRGCAIMSCLFVWSLCSLLFNSILFLCWVFVKMADFASFVSPYFLFKPVLLHIAQTLLLLPHCCCPPRHPNSVYANLTLQPFFLITLQHSLPTCQLPLCVSAV